MTPEVIDIPALFAAIAAKVNTVLSTRTVDPFPVYYDYGRYLEITRNLIVKDGGTTTKMQKYPIIWVVVPYKVGEPYEGNEAFIKNMQIVIATQTTPNKTTPERYDLTFRPRLWPIYNELRKQIVASGYFVDIDIDNFLERTDQPYWDGKDGNMIANMFNDLIDAVQLTNISLKLNEQTCQQFRLIGSR